MDLMEGIAATATSLSAAQLQESYSIAVSKKAMDTQEMAAQSMLEMLAQQPTRPRAPTSTLTPDSPQVTETKPRRHKSRRGFASLCVLVCFPFSVILDLQCHPVVPDSGAAGDGELLILAGADGLPVKRTASCSIT